MYIILLFVIIKSLKMSEFIYYDNYDILIVYKMVSGIMGGINRYFNIHYSGMYIFSHTLWLSDVLLVWPLDVFRWTFLDANLRLP